MNHAELTSALAKISDHIHVKKLDIKSQKKRLAFALEYALQGEATEETTEKEKAEDALFDMIENTEDPCKQWELAQWLVSLLPAEVVRDLSGRRDKNQDAAPDRARADSAKIALADLYIQMNALQYQLEVLVEEQKSIQKSLKLAA